jgi:hypothetical protein
MRYPIYAFFFVLVLPPFTAHALLAGKAEVPRSEPVVASTAAPAVVASFQLRTMVLSR